MPSSALKRALVLPVFLTLALAGLGVVAGSPATAVSTGLAISEVYGGGGNAGATLNQDYVELVNPTAASISVASMSVQYRSATGTANPSGVVPLTGSVPAGGHYLVGLASGATGAAIPAPDATGTGVNLSATNGTVFLADQTTVLTAPPTGSVLDNPAILDLVGYGTSNTFETTAAAAPSDNTVSLTRSGADTDVNSADFGAATPTPEPSTGGGDGGGTCPTAPQTIAQIEGDDTDTSPCAGSAVSTTGVVTGVWPTGGFNGFEIQTGGTPDSPDASDAVFVYGGPSGFATYPTLGVTVDVDGTVSEFAGQTEVDNATWSGSANSQPAVVPLTVVPGTDCAMPGDACLSGAALDAAREQHEGELYEPTAPYTVTDPYDGSPAPSTSSSFFGEIGLAADSTASLVAPTEVYDSQTQAAQIDQLKAYNAAHLVIVDDGASTNYSTTTDQPFPWLTATHYVRDNAAVTFDQPFVLGYRNSEWKLEPQAQVTGDGSDQVTFAQDRPAAPADVGGNLRLATFNVLNYFPTTGEEFASQPGNACTYFTDRDGNPVTDRSCTPNGPRGAADAANLQRQQDKIVHAINHLGADIVSLEEIENSVQFGKDRDFGVQTLVAALNADAGAGTWAYAPSPDAAHLPPTADQDVIRTAFIYKPATVALVGGSEVLTGSAAFTNAREPLAQAFKRNGDPDSNAFAVVVNHLKSKGDDGASPASGDNADTGQGFYNGDRVRQADAMLAFADQFQAERGVSAVFLTGDYNSYSQEDPVQEVEADGYTDLGGQFDPQHKSYNFGGLDGSLDHVFANAAGLAMVHGADIWQSNANESVYYEYSRDNYNATNLYNSSPYRASDHNPEVVGLDLPTTKAPSRVLATATPRHVRAGQTRPLVSVLVLSGHGVVPTGTVTITVEDQGSITVALHHGIAIVRLGSFAHPGPKTVEVTYSGDDAVAGSSTSFTIEVTRSHQHHGHGHGHGHHHHHH